MNSRTNLSLWYQNGAEMTCVMIGEEEWKSLVMCGLELSRCRRFGTQLTKCSIGNVHVGETFGDSAPFLVHCICTQSKWSENSC